MESDYEPAQLKRQKISMQQVNHHEDPVQREYARLAHVYDKRWSFYIQSTLQETLKRLRVKQGQCVLDVGCGTGVLLKTLAETYPDVALVGIDPTQEMLAVACQRLPKTIRLEQAEAEKLPFDDESFDTVISCNMFHNIREPVAALKEMRRVLKPAGTFIVTDWCDDYLICRMCNLFLTAFNPAHLRPYRMEECSNLLTTSGFREINIERYKISWLWGLMTATAHKSAA